MPRKTKKQKQHKTYKTIPVFTKSSEKKIKPAVKKETKTDDRTYYYRQDLSRSLIITVLLMALLIGLVILEYSSIISLETVIHF
ncbi:hypothetical protein KC726_04565 [Candidatus Woesebacteria bacterium]|nr:hypothetical protein [Candidatus Woesebacteria bacterium]